VNPNILNWQRIGLVLAALMTATAPAHGLVFQWQENPWPEPDMQLGRVAASPDVLIATGSRGVSPAVEPVAVSSIDGRDWQIIDIGMDGRTATDLIYTGTGFIVALEDGNLLIGDVDEGWNEVAPPAELRQQSPDVLEHQGRILLFGRVASDPETSQVIATEDFGTWELVWERTLVTGGSSPNEPVSSGAAIAMGLLPGPPAAPVNQLLFSMDGGNQWETFNGGQADFDLGALAVRGPTLYGVGRDPLQGVQPLQTLRRTPPEPDWQRVFHPDIQVENPGPIRGGAPGLVLQARVAGQHALLTSSDALSWTPQSFTPSAAISDFVAWRDGWVGVGQAAVLGLPQASVPVPGLSRTGIAMMMLSLLALALLERTPRTR